MPLSWGRVAKVMSSPHRHPKSGMFWFPRAVPKALALQVAAVLGRPGKPAWELKWTLGTHDIREAKLAMPAAMMKADAILDAARNGARPLSHREMHGLAGLWYRSRLREWEADPAAEHYWDHWDMGMPTDPYVEGTEHDDHPVVSKQWQREWSHFRGSFMPEVDALLASEGVVTDAPSKERLAELIVERLPQALGRQSQQRRGDYSADPLPATFPDWKRPEAVSQAAVQGPSVPLGDLYAAWKVVAVVKPRVAGDTEYIVKALIEFVGHNDAARMTRDDIGRWRDAMKAKDGSNNTWNNRLSMVRQVFKHGVAEHRLTTDPTDGMRLRKSRQQSPPPYSDDEATRILLAARLETKPSLRWAHWVMAFTGMRAGEVLQLLGRDVRQEGGIHYLDVNESDSTQSVKTGLRRHVPVHAALVQEGFINYARTIAPDAPVFPDKRLDRYGKRGGRAWNLIGMWVWQKAGITDPTKAPDHSWRHRVEDELRAAEVPEDARDAILGHARKTTGRQYGVRREALTRLHRYLSTLPVPPGITPCERSAA
jgi:integrase